MRSRSHVSDRVLTHFTASKWPLKVLICSIVPSGHSASTDHCGPSVSTTQKTGFTIATRKSGAGIKKQIQPSRRIPQFPRTRPQATVRTNAQAMTATGTTERSNDMAGLANRFA